MKKTLRNLTAVLGITLLGACSSNRQQPGAVSQDVRIHELDIPNSKCNTCSENHFFRYAGMPSKDSFSVAGNSSFSVNFYYPVSATNIHFREGFGIDYSLKIVEVTPDKLKFRILDKK